MPVARSDSQRKQTAVSRTDSLRSERSDKRVSFNNDVGVKHIPRGQKDLVKSKLPKDEWSGCTPVHLERPTLSAEELERQAEDLVKLLDQVDCVSGGKSTNKSNSAFDKANNKIKANNVKVLNTDKKKNNLINNLGKTPKSNNHSIGDAKTKNPLQLPNKENVNANRQLHLNKINNNHRRRALSALPQTPPGPGHPYAKYSTLFKSVPDLPTSIHYDNENKALEDYSYLIDHNGENTKTFMSVDNLYDNRGKKLTAPNNYKKIRNEYKSADNLTDISIPGTRKLTEYKPYENLRSGFSSTTDIKMNDSYSPKIETLIKRLNSDNSDHQVRTHKIYIEKGDDNSEAYNQPNSLNSLKNNNKRFSYTSAPLSSVAAIRRVSPSRDSYKTKDDFYSQTNRNQRIARSSSREYEPNSRNTDSDFSAKIIISGNNVHPRYDDENAYETYQVGENSFHNYGTSSDNLTFDAYKNHSNNNINMSSIGVQTDGLPKAPSRFRRNDKPISPNRADHQNVYGDELSSASLVRRINHGFGRFDRSPSPPTYKPHSSRRVSRCVVPLLSDTDESEIDYHRRMDPLAKIRYQVMVREKLQEEKEAEEQEEMFFERQQNNLPKLHSTDLQPLTVDEIDELTLEVDKKGKNKLVVAHENATENNHSIVRSTTPKPRKSSPDNKRNSTGIFATLERFKKNNTESGKGTVKKKKKMKIKFLYDPKTHDQTYEDPLVRYTEYKGTDSISSKNRRRSHEDDSYEDYYNDSRNEFRSLPRDSYLARKGRRHKVEHRDSFNRNGSPMRPPRSTSRDRSEDVSKVRNVRESSNDRMIRNDGKSDRDFRQNNMKSETRFSYNSTDRSDAKLKDKKLNSSRYNYNQNQTKSESAKHFTNIRNKFSNESKEDLTGQKKVNYYESDHHDSSDQGPSLSDKYRHLRQEPSPIDPKFETNNEEKFSDVETSNKKDKIQRQRSKFLGVLMGEGRSKSPSGARTLTKESPSSKSSTLKKGSKVDHNSPVEVKLDKTKDKKSLKNATSGNKRRRKHPWPWSLLRLRGPSGRRKDVGRVSRPSSRASSRSSTARRPTVRSSKIRKDIHEVRPYIARDRQADSRETQQWESATLNRSEGRIKKRAPSPPRHQRNDLKYSADSSHSSTATPTGVRVGRTSSFQHKYFGDSDTDKKRRPILTNNTDNYRSLPNRKVRAPTSRQNLTNRRVGGMRKMSPGARGSAGSSLQSSESEADSHGGSHASRASHVSTGSNRSVYLHATAVADIPVRRNSDENSERALSRQSKKVSRSFSLIAPWKPRHYRESHEVEYDNREVLDMKSEKKNALPPRPPRKLNDVSDNKKVNRSQTVYKDSKLAGWLRKKRSKEAKGI